MALPHLRVGHCGVTLCWRGRGWSWGHRRTASAEDGLPCVADDVVVLVPLQRLKFHVNCDCEIISCDCEILN